jgi:competence protein ComFC
LLEGKNVLLIDDVLTTGATLEEAARTLKKAGAHQVAAVVFAHKV